MNTAQKLPCPNCGKRAIRRRFISNDSVYSSCPQKQVLQTECPACDYIMTMCSLSGNVIEAHGPSTSSKVEPLWDLKRFYTAFGQRAGNF